MGQNPSTPPAWGIELSKLWVQSSMPFPIKPIEIAYEVSKVRFDDKIAAIKGHNATGIDGMLTKSSKANEWFILYDETVQSKGRMNFRLPWFGVNTYYIVIKNQILSAHNLKY